MLKVRERMECQASPGSWQEAERTQLRLSVGCRARCAHGGLPGRASEPPEGDGPLGAGCA